MTNEQPRLTIDKRSPALWAVTFANPPITYSNDDLPHPDGPITATDSPGCTSKFTPRSAGTSTLPAR